MKPWSSLLKEHLTHCRDQVSVFCEHSFSIASSDPHPDPHFENKKHAGKALEVSVLTGCLRICTAVLELRCSRVNKILKLLSNSLIFIACGESLTELHRCSSASLWLALMRCWWCDGIRAGEVGIMGAEVIFGQVLCAHVIASADTSFKLYSEGHEYLSRQQHLRLRKRINTYKTLRKS